MQTAPSHNSDQRKPSDEMDRKVTLTFHSVDELLEHLNITDVTTEVQKAEAEEEHRTSNGCGCYIAVFIAIMIVGLFISIFFARIISY